VVPWGGACDVEAPGAALVAVARMPTKQKTFVKSVVERRTVVTTVTEI
jgi:hypothetical protein